MSELVTAINRLSAAIETYNQTNSVMQLVDKVPGMDALVGRFVEAKLTEKHPEILSYGLDVGAPGTVGIADGYELVKKQESAPLLAGQIEKGRVGQPYKILATSQFYQALVGHVLYYQGLLNAHWVKFHDNLELSESGKPMVYYLHVDTQVEAVDLPVLDPDDIQIGQVVACGDLKERHADYSYEVVDGSDRFDFSYVGHIVYGGAEIFGQDAENPECGCVEFPFSTKDDDVVLGMYTKLKRVEDYNG